MPVANGTTLDSSSEQLVRSLSIIQLKQRNGKKPFVSRVKVHVPHKDVEKLKLVYTVVVVQFRFGEENTANLRDLWQLFCSHGVGCWLSSA